jgi:hypothetical protein
MSAKGGAWARMIPLFKFGVGGKLGSGKQYWSFISIDDEVAALKFLLTASNISGPVNLTAPHPATNNEVTKAMSSVFRRPALLPAPAFGLKLVLGEFSTEVLSSSRVLPKKLLAAGFTFANPDIESATRKLLP